MSWSVEEELRCTPTWRAKCQMWGSGKTLKVRTLGCARSSFPPTDLCPSSLRSRGRTRRTHNTEDTRFILVRATVVV